MWQNSVIIMLLMTQKNIKVLMKQTKKQSTYSCAGQKLTVNSEYIAYYPLCSFSLLTQ